MFDFYGDWYRRRRGERCRRNSFLCCCLKILPYWVIQKLPQICAVILRICIEKVAWFAVYICSNFWVPQYILHCKTKIKDQQRYLFFLPRAGEIYRESFKTFFLLLKLWAQQERGKARELTLLLQSSAADPGGVDPDSTLYRKPDSALEKKILSGDETKKILPFTFSSK